MPDRYPPCPEFRVFELPPKGFKPLEASNEELARYGFPHPKDERQRAFVERHLNRLGGKLKVIQPEIRYNPGKVHGPRLRVVDEAPTTSHNWSGAVVYNEYGTGATAYTFAYVVGEWVLPSVYPPSNEDSSLGCWVGIDGDGISTDVCQAGVELALSGSKLTVTPWIEWYPAHEMAIANCPVRPGDDVLVEIQTLTPVGAGGAGSTEACVIFCNMSTGVTTGLRLSAPGNTSLVGNCAEWIVEAPQVNGQIQPLCQYGGVIFTEATASTVNGTAGDSGDPNLSNTINLIPQTGGGTSVGEVLGETIVGATPAVTVG